jgi:hypothetical protein
VARGTAKAKGVGKWGHRGGEKGTEGRQMGTERGANGESVARGTAKVLLRDLECGYISHKPYTLNPNP